MNQYADDANKTETHETNSAAQQARDFTEAIRLLREAARCPVDGCVGGRIYRFCTLGVTHEGPCNYGMDDCTHPLHAFLARFPEAPR